MSNTYKFPCGCEFPIVGDKIKSFSHPLVEWDVLQNNTNLNCAGAWDLMCSGFTKGIFQVESQLGRHWCKEIQPNCIEDLAAIGALMRPGCISHDTKILLRYHTHKDGKDRYYRTTMENLYKNKKKYKSIFSYDEKNKKIVDNKIIDVLYNGKKDVYLVKMKNSKRGPAISRTKILKCTLDHKLLTNNGWKELSELKIGDRIATLNRRKKQKSNGKKYFSSICRHHYEYKCVMCDWNLGSLDVNHLEGNRYSNNNPENLVFLCPNHHRMYSEKNLSKEEVVKNREKYILSHEEDVQWAEYDGMEYIGKEDVYDIMMEAPNHNFIAGDTIVHNCLEAKLDGKSMTQHYADRKRGIEPVPPYNPILDEILSKTYGVLVYQEQTLEIAKRLAGFSLQEADTLRKGIGKKDASVVAECKKMFIEKASTFGVISKEQAEEIFGWIEKSARYSFNKSHAVSYALVGYWTAYAKYHFSIEFFTSWLSLSAEKILPHKEVAELVSDINREKLDILCPDFRVLNTNFITDGKLIRFGLTNVKGIGESVLEKIIDKKVQVERVLNKN
jgi:ribosomal protein S13